MDRKRKRKKRKNRRGIRLGVVAAVFCLILVIVGILYAVWRDSQLPTAPADSQQEEPQPMEPAPEKAPDEPKDEPTAEPSATQTEETPHFEWNSEWGSNEVVSGQYYFAGVNREQGVVTIYVAEEGSDTYNLPVRAMICSGGEDTIMSEPGTSFRTSHKYRWRALAGNVYGQYAVRISGPYLFHSVPYYSPDVADLEYPEYNKLGTAASMGCIRLSIVDVKWIYDNCPLGMPVVIYDDSVPGPLGKPEKILIDEADTTLRGWDPTDVDPANPYQSTEQWEELKNGTAIEANTDKILYGLGENDPLGTMWG